MKRLIIAAMLFSTHSFSQPVIGFKSGYSFKANAVIFNLQAGAKLGNSHIYYNQVVHLTRNADVNQIVGLRYGYNIGSFQPFIGYDYHLSTHRAIESNGVGTLVEKQNNAGFFFAYGITKYFEKLPLMISIDMSGKYVNAGIGLYKVLN